MVVAGRWTDEEGYSWIEQEEALRHFAAVRPATLRQWIRRGRVRAFGGRGKRWVCWDELADAERAARRAGWRAGQRTDPLSR